MATGWRWIAVSRSGAVCKAVGKRGALGRLDAVDSNEKAGVGAGPVSRMRLGCGDLTTCLAFFGGCMCCGQLEVRCEDLSWRATYEYVHL